MTRRIRVLPDAVANQIAAGEAVERPASVVKELVENALDAGATRVEVAVERGGKRLIRVSDDGVGMGREDALLCFDRHATSKIVEASDLVSVKTFGFRGEALPSIASVARVVLETFDGVGDAGTRVKIDGGRITQVDDFPRQRGTTVEVRNLFFNAPVRAKFLKSVAPETRAISETLTGLALANPRVAFSLKSDTRSLLELEGVDDPAHRVAQLWGGEQAGTLISADSSEGGFDIHGLVQRPDAAKPGVRRSYLFVNGRPFRGAALLKAADRGYRTTIPAGSRPWLFLYLRIPGDDVDVNVHPTKAEVRFRDHNKIEALIEDTVRSALDGPESSATFDTHLGSLPLVVRERSEKAPSGGAPDDQMALFMSGLDPAPGVEGEATIVPTDLGASRPRLWQVMNTYVLAETRDGLLVVDQHSAHERILYQRLMDAFERGGEHGQRLLFPLTIRLSAAEVECIGDLSSLLGRAGFEVEEFGGDTVIVQAVPNPHPYFDAERAFREMVQELTHGSDLVRSARNQHERIAMTFACKSAIKAGQRLSQPEMQELFDQLFATELPHHDVHGRPTVVRLSAAELARKFGRS
ncbi:MAG: DNA mismatch repair endonuclease MutL [Gemmatimonadota bacterium]|nr:DNA mismatch repair endonuclease MutL [Gemmatimonadota bacterium]MDH3424334.1 DNA mismatch repair endonuclease MutL [Gemmatimonadota bacterium]